MLVVMNSNATEVDIKRVALFLESKGFEARISHGEARTIVHAIGIIEVDQRDFEVKICSKVVFSFVGCDFLP